MKESTKKLLDTELDTKFYSLFGSKKGDKIESYSLRDLFEKYLSSEITSLDDLFKSSEDFKEYITAVPNFLKMDSPSATVFYETLMCMLNNYDFWTTVYDNKSDVAKYHQFIDTIDILVPNKDSSILDVGASPMPYTSFLLAQKFRDVTAMDFSHNTFSSYFKNLGVTYRNEYLKPDTDISQYDTVIGRHPCGAIETIVSMCSGGKKPYFIEMCNCEFSGDRYEQIISYLKHKDRHLRSHERYVPKALSDMDRIIYVHNLEGSDKYIEEVLDHTDMA